MKPKFNNLRSLATIAISFAGIIQFTQAATDTWSGATDGIWDTTTSNWVSDGSDTLFNTGNDVLFTGTPANGVTAATGLTIGAITLDSTFTGSVMLTGANTISAATTINGGTLSTSNNNQLGTSAITLGGGTLRVDTTAATLTNSHLITVGAGGGTINVANTSGATHTLIMGAAGNLTGSGTLTVTSGGALVHGTGATDLVLGNANAGYTGNLVLQNGGILEYANAGGVAAAATFTVNNNGELSTFVAISNAVTLNTGSTLAFQNTNNGVFAGPITLNGDTSVRLRDWYGTTNRNGTISSTITGAHKIDMNSGGDTGTGATLTLKGFDAKASSADIILDSASLAIDSSAGAAGTSVTRANSLTINTGNLTVTGVATQNTNDIFGTLNLGGGSSSITPGGPLQGYSTWALPLNASSNTALTFTNMGTRTPGSWVAINGTIGVTPAANTSNIFFTNAPTGSNFIGDGGAPNSGTASVIPWMHDTTGGNIYGYDPTVGAAPISTVNKSPEASTPGQNINFNAAAPTLTTNRSINSYQMGFSGNNLGGFTLTVASGVITADGANFNNGTLDFGTAEGQVQVHQARQLNIDATITGSGGLTAYGFRSNSGNKGTLILNGANTYTGATNIYGYGAGNNFVLFLTNSLALQNSTLNYVAGRASNISFGNGGTSGQTAYTFGGLGGNANINLNNNNTTVGPVALTVGGNNDSTTYSGVLSSTVAGGSLTKQGTGTLTLTGANTYSGDTTVNGGVLAVNGTAIPDAGKLIIVSGKVAPTGTEVVATLYFGAAQQAAGTWGATGSGAAHIDNTHFASGSSGVISVAGGPSGYSSWASGEGLTTGVDDGASQDPDGDGIPNLLEYVLGGHPAGPGAANTGILPIQTVDPSNVTLTFNRSNLSKTDTTQTVQISTGLGTWTDFATVGATSSGAVTVTPGSPADAVSVVVPRTNEVNGKLFVRLQVVK